MPVSVLLVQNGVFPASPTRVQTGVSIDMLEIYCALFERSCDAITALASALHTIYERRGFRVLGQKNIGQLATDPFRKLLGHAVLWYSNIKERINLKLNAALTAAEHALSPPNPAGPTSTPAPAPPPAPPPLAPGRASRALRERCPACFGLEEWGRSLRDGGDVQLGADGCFSYRHLRAAGDGPISYDPTYFASKEKVAKVNNRILEARKRKSTNYKPCIPQEALDACQESWNVANEKKQKADPKYYDASGVFVLTCRHSQVIFLCDIDTPGEQQKYIVALMEEVNSHLPPQATILQAYDVGCVTDHSFNLFPILTEGFRERVSFIINAMHAFGHRWVCQLVYSPRCHDGAGLSDMEGVERLWSRIRKLIPLTRAQWNSRRIWTIDQYTSFVNQEGLDGLGGWLHRQLGKNLPKKRQAAAKTLSECGVPEAELREQWQAQKLAQTSARSHAPVRLRRELDKVLKLQDQIDAVEKSIHEAKQSLTGGTAPADSLTHIRHLQSTHESLSSQAEALYASLNIHDSFPELRGLPLDFVRTLIIMRDLKMNIRDRAIESFYEWETLDCAVAGRREPLGTKLHQATQKAISKRTPALLKAIGKFNDHCSNLERLCPLGCNIPIPTALPTQLNPLREDPMLHEDVWLTPQEGEIPRWMDDEDVRDGIRSLLVLDRCNEEMRRLNIERRNLERWLDHKLTIVQHAMAANTDILLELPLRLRQQHVQDLRLSWRLPQLTLLTNFIASVPAPDRAATSAPRPNRTAAANRNNRVLATNRRVHAGPSVAGPANRAPATTLSSGLSIDTTFPQDLRNHNATLPISELQVPCVVVGLRSCPSIEIGIPDLNRLSSPTGRLNDVALNGAAAALLNLYSQPHSPYANSAGDCVILDTFDLHRIRFKASDAMLWKFLGPTEYWTRRLWIIPIHRPKDEHWVVVVAAVQEQRLFFLDSLNQRKGWRRDIQGIHCTFRHKTRIGSHDLSLMRRAPVLLAIDLLIHFPPQQAQLQSNGHDCGVWVLCVVACVLRGFHCSNVTEALMPSVRRLLTNHILALPFVTRAQY
ncbi:hypothetical protein B0H14DRAFT_2396104 [Mycena olivaceomarginata]|nr:hypothetical protein B0H14DRAFT_2396104 [Mycena olivaceomarginata]